MDKWNVFEIDLTGKHRKLSPEAGFTTEANARAYARIAAAGSRNKCNSYLVVNGELVEVFPGKGTTATEDSAAGFDDDMEL